MYTGSSRLNGTGFTNDLVHPFYEDEETEYMGGCAPHLPIYVHFSGAFHRADGGFKLVIGEHLERGKAPGELNERGAERVRYTSLLFKFVILT